jgi:hypothetical protein
MTTAISRRANGFLANRFIAFGVGVNHGEMPDYLTAYDASKAIHTATKAAREFGDGAQ